MTLGITILGAIPLGSTPLAMTLPGITLQVSYCPSDLRYLFSVSHHKPSLYSAFSGFESRT